MLGGNANRSRNLMRKLIALVGLLALVPGLSPARAHALTLSQRVARLEAKLTCMRKIPVVEYTDFTWYGDPATGENAVNTYDTESPTDTPTNDNPDGLTDLGSVAGVDFAFETAGPDYYVLAVRAKNNSLDATTPQYPGCGTRFGIQPTPLWWRTASRMTHLRQLARTE
jgi:hypothetical protein